MTRTLVSLSTAVAAAAGIVVSTTAGCSGGIHIDPQRPGVHHQIVVRGVGLGKWIELGRCVVQLGKRLQLRRRFIELGWRVLLPAELVPLPVQLPGWRQRFRLSQSAARMRLIAHVRAGV